MHYKALAFIDAMRTRLSHPWRTPLLLAVLFLMAAAGCGGERKPTEAAEATPVVGTSGAGEEHGDEEEEVPNEITLSPEQAEAAGIEVASVDEQEVRGVLTAPARIVPTETAAAEVGSLVAGRVTRLFVRDGSPVRQGAPMAEIESLEIGRLKGDYLRAHAVLEQTRSAFERQQLLAREEIGARRTLEEARAAYHTAEADLTALLTQLAALGIDPKSLEEAAGALESKIVIRAPIAGIVTRREVTLGAFVEPSQDLFEVVNPNAVYADAQVPPDAVARLKPGDPALVRTAAGPLYRGKITFVSPAVDPESRTVQVRVQLENTRGLRSESYVTAEFDADLATKALVVPARAVEREAGTAYVYRESAPNTFERIEVRTGAETAESAVILTGLKAGDRIATDGVFYLKSARQKGELGDDD